MTFILDKEMRFRPGNDENKLENTRWQHVSKRRRFRPMKDMNRTKDM